MKTIIRDIINLILGLIFTLQTLYVALVVDVSILGMTIDYCIIEGLWVLSTILIIIAMVKINK